MHRSSGSLVSCSERRIVKGCEGMDKYADLKKDPKAIETITVLEKELSAKLGADVVLVAYGGTKIADLGDKALIEKITSLEKDLSEATGKEVVLVAFSV